MDRKTGLVALTIIVLAAISYAAVHLGAEFQTKTDKDNDIQNKEELADILIQNSNSELGRNVNTSYTTVKSSFYREGEVDVAQKQFKATSSTGSSPLFVYSTVKRHNSSEAAENAFNNYLSKYQVQNIETPVPMTRQLEASNIGTVSYGQTYEVYAHNGKYLISLDIQSIYDSKVVAENLFMLMYIETN
ncbi:hypothetical protein [Candidatus Nanohalobium constans]|uniref:Uncharacterized protein n=1 Tax=Candidatus Nanohalobium constans TaxID=2565781 RepID=A0A5Q0UH05_9ARCH|nr:hypothetical protein [Candidatus Nanohalobium constans]QGA80908.1 hypothetical protein LC1Nh_1035 [Candidatus Nanohalobium constans]